VAVRESGGKRDAPKGLRDHTQVSMSDIQEPVLTAVSVSLLSGCCAGPGLERSLDDRYSEELHISIIDHPPRFRCTKYSASMSSFEAYPTMRTTRVKGPHRYSPSRAAANLSRDPSWMSYGNARWICAPFSGPCLRIPGLLPMVSLYVRGYAPWSRLEPYPSLSPC